MAIMRFKDSDIEAFWENPRCPPKRVPADCRKTLYRKLQMLDAACSLQDLRIPPGNRLERLQGTRLGQCSIRVNAQWRLCFKWTDGEAREVEFCDYH